MRGLLDIKLLRQVNADGLEQWDPVVKAALPLTAGNVANIVAALQLGPDSLCPRSYTLDEFVQALSAFGTPMQVVKTTSGGPVTYSAAASLSLGR